MNKETSNPDDSGLTDKQKRFVDAYVGTARLNATAAALAAGYAESSSSRGCGGTGGGQRPYRHRASSTRFFSSHWMNSDTRNCPVRS